MLGERLMVSLSLAFVIFLNENSFVLVEDEVHSDFIALRSMLIRTNLNDLRDVTHNIHYENYRYKKLSSFNGNDMKTGRTASSSSVNK